MVRSFKDANIHVIDMERFRCSLHTDMDPVRGPTGERSSVP